jgi:serine/threonine-protein kinase GIN4
LTKILKSPPGLDVFEDSRDDAPPPTAADNQSRILFKSKSQPRVNTLKSTHFYYSPDSLFTHNAFRIAQHSKKRAAPIADLSPIKASPTPSPVHPPANLHLNTPTRTPVSASTKAKENISTFNKLAASVVAAGPRKGTPGRAPFGALNQNSMGINPRPTSVVSKKPSGHSHGAKAIKVLGELKVANIVDNAVNAGCNFDASFVSAGTADRSKDSTNVRDRVIDWERERQRIREMGRLNDMERERDDAYKRQKKEKKRQKETGKDIVVKEDAAEVEEPNVGKENISESHDLDRLHQEVPEKKPRLVNRKSPSHLHIQIPGSSRQPIDGDADVGPRQEAPKMNHQDDDSDNIFTSVTSPVLPMFSTGPRLTQGQCIVFS